MPTEDQIDAIIAAVFAEDMQKLRELLGDIEADAYADGLADPSI